jgi:hypothetical protein
MTQTGLIKKMIATTKMENCNPNWVPAAKEALGIHPEGNLWKRIGVTCPSSECCCMSRPTT